MTSKNFWYLDFEGYCFERYNVFIKEIAILSNDGTKCYNYHIYHPTPTDLNRKFSNVACYQYHRHFLPWEFGKYDLLEALTDIKEKIGSDDIFIKGEGKCEYLKQFFPNMKCLPENPSIYMLNNCLNETCNFKHGKYCARRKVFELYYKQKYVS